MQCLLFLNAKTRSVWITSYPVTWSMINDIQDYSLAFNHTFVYSDEWPTAPLPLCVNMQRCSRKLLEICLFVLRLVLQLASDPTQFSQELLTAGLLSSSPLNYHTISIILACVDSGVNGWRINASKINLINYKWRPAGASGLLTYRLVKLFSG